MIFLKIEINLIILSFFISTRCFHRLFKIQKVYFLSFFFVFIKIEIEIYLLILFFLFFIWILSINIIFLGFLYLLFGFHLIRGTRYYLRKINCLLLVGVKIKLSWFLFGKINFIVSSIFISLKLKLIIIFIILIFTILFSDLLIFMWWLRLIKRSKIKCFLFFWYYN